MKMTHEWARQLLADINCPLDWPICRACGKRLAPRSGITTGATQIGEGCFAFHYECRNALNPAQVAEMNLCSSKLFEGR